MGAFIKGDIVVVPFPFSDLTNHKKRPALVLATMTGDDVILCQITSKTVADAYALPLSDADLAQGALQQESNIRPNRLFTADSRIILRRVGVLAPPKLHDALERVIRLLTA